MFIISWVLLAAHFSRADNNIIAIFCLMIPFLMFIKKKWILTLLSILTFSGGIVWLHTAYTLTKARIGIDESWVRMAIIIIIVSLFTLLSGYFINSGKIRKSYK